MRFSRLTLVLLVACFGLTGCGGGEGSQTPLAAPTTTSLLSALSRNGPVTIMPLGDSITYGYADPSGDGYRKELWNSLTQSGIAMQYRGSLRNGSADLPDTRNEGHRTYQIGEMASGVDGWLKDTQPEVILLMIGTNDVKYQLDGAADRLSALIDQIHQDDPQAHLLVASIPPMTDSGGIFEPNVEAYNADIPGLVAAKAAAGEPVTYVDVHDALTPSDLVDGVHPTQGGYAKIGDTWFQALQKL